MRSALAVHDQIVRNAFESAGGLVFATGGNGFGAAFSRAGQAVAAGLAAQRGLADQQWPEGISLQVRTGLHTGEADERDGDYFGPDVNRAARLMAIAHGGKIVCSPATADLARGHLPAEVALVDVGVHRLRDLSEPLRVFEVAGDGLPEISAAAVDGRLPRKPPVAGQLVHRPRNRVGSGGKSPGRGSGGHPYRRGRGGQDPLGPARRLRDIVSVP
jgi:class 3 adenylate cyclase